MALAYQPSLNRKAMYLVAFSDSLFTLSTGLCEKFLLDCDETLWIVCTIGWRLDFGIKSDLCFD